MTKTALRIERVKDIDALEGIRDDWNALLEKNETKTVELTYEWQMSYWKYFNENAELFVLIVREGGSVVAIAPLRLIHTKVLGIQIRRLEFIAAAESNYQDFIIGKDREQVLEGIWDHLLSNIGSWDILSLRHIPAASTTTGHIFARRDGSLLCRIANIEKCLFLESDITWEEYASSTKTLRMAINKRMKRLRRFGEVS